MCIRDRDLGIDGIVAAAGAYVEYEGKVVYHKCMTKEQREKLGHYLKDNNFIFSIQTDTRLITTENCKEKLTEGFVKACLLYTSGTCYSQVTLAKELRVNPATAAKGINLLVNRGILIKHRGQAMTVSENAIEMITKRKRHEEIDLVVDNLIKLGKKLSLSKDELIEIITRKYED